MVQRDIDPAKSVCRMLYVRTALFPDGQKIFDEKRQVKLHPSRIVNTPLFNIDNRFARDTNYIFLHNLQMRCTWQTTAYTYNYARVNLLGKTVEKFVHRCCKTEIYHTPNQITIMSYLGAIFTNLYKLLLKSIWSETPLPHAQPKTIILSL